MGADELIKKVENYLTKKNISYMVNSIKYKGFRENIIQIDGSEKSFYIVSYMSIINDNEYDSTAFYFVHIDPKTNKLIYILGPQSLEMIEE